MKGVYLFLLITIAMLQFSGCGESIEDKIHSAEAAISAAAEAEAPKYAPESYKKALDALEAAKALKEQEDRRLPFFRDDEQLIERYSTAEKLAEQAKSEAELAKNRIASDASKLASRIREMIHSAELQLKNIPHTRGREAEIQLLKISLESASQSINRAQADINNGNFLEAKRKLQSILVKVQELSSEIKYLK